MVKEIERYGLTVVHACSIVPISRTVGANRIVPTVAIPHPFGDPDKSRDEEKTLRRDLVRKALQALAVPVKEQTVFS